MRKYQNTQSQSSLVEQYAQPLISSPKYLPKSNNPQIQHEIYLLESHYSIQIQKTRFELQKLISENARLQQQLRQEKDRSFSLVQIKRRLEEEIKRMEFELERMSNYQLRINKETAIRSDNLLSQNLRLSRKVDQLLKQLTQTKETHRIHLVDHNNLRRNYEVLQKSMNSVIAQRNQIRVKFDRTKNQYPSENDISLKLKSSIKPNDATLKTMPSSTINNHQSIQIFMNQQIKGQIASPQKLRAVKSEQKFQAIEQLNNQFYEQQVQIYKNSFPQQKKNPSKVFKSTQIQQKIPEQGSSNFFMLKTFQRNQLSSQLTALRVQIINQVLEKYYKKSVQIAKKKNTNCLKQFINLLGKFQNIKALGKMAENYLQAKKTVKEECGETDKKTKITQDWVGSIFAKVKQQGKKNVKAQSFHLSIFRLLTIYSKIPSTHALLPEIQHTAIKNIYKLKQKILQ